MRGKGIGGMTVSRTTESGDRERGNALDRVAVTVKWYDYVLMNRLSW